MKYHYFYHTKDNRMLDGWIVAKSRHDVYVELKKQGIKPYKLIGKDPLPWKRWAAIGVLSVALAASTTGLIHYAAAAEGSATARAQLYGDAATIQQISADGWRASFPDAGDAWLARHAIPGIECDCASLDADDTAISTTRLEISRDDPPELAKMKRMVNGMKAELESTISSGGDLAAYIRKCHARIEEEMDFLERCRWKFSMLRLRLESAPSILDVKTDWSKINDELRSRGLATTPFPQ